MNNTICKNCGADRGLHHFQTNQCPVGGREEIREGHKQEWKTSVFELDEAPHSERMYQTGRETGFYEALNAVNDLLIKHAVDPDIRIKALEIQPKKP